MPTTTETPKCPKCASSRVHWRRRTEDWACDRCPATWKVGLDKKKEKK